MTDLQTYLNHKITTPHIWIRSVGKNIKTIQGNSKTDETYNISFSMEELLSATQATNHSAPDLDDVHNVMLKHLPLDKLVSFLNLCN